MGSSHSNGAILGSLRRWRCTQGVVHCTLSVCCDTVLPSYLAVSVSPSSLSPAATLLYPCSPAIPCDFHPSPSAPRVPVAVILSVVCLCQLYHSLTLAVVSHYHPLSSITLSLLSLCHSVSFHLSELMSADL